MKQSWLVFLGVWPALATAQQTPQPPERTVVVSAYASVEREPERAVVMLAVESTGPTARQAAQTNATKMDAVVAALRRLGITGRNVRTSSYELHPEYARPTREEETRGVREPRIVGYRAHNMVTVIVDTVSRVGGVIDAALAAGANRVNNLQFDLRDPQAARVEALRQAVAKARAEAEAIAAAAGQRLGQPLNISTSQGYVPVGRIAGMRDMAMEGVAAAAPPPTPIEAGTLNVTAYVTIVFRLEGS